MAKATLIITLIFSLAVIAALVWLFTRPAVPKPYADEYHTALAQIAGSVDSTERGLENFERLYSDLASEGVAEAVRTAYAGSFYFNDTIKTFRGREELASYMIAMSEILQRSDVSIDQTIRDGADVFVRWTMEFETSAAGREVRSRTIGMTHLRFDPTGQIVLHQDFWDPATGIYRHMPVLGYVLNQADLRMSR